MTIKLTSTNLTKQLVRRAKLVQHLDSAIQKFDENFEFKITPKEKDDAFHPSGDCTPTVVELYEKAVAHLEGTDTFGPISTSLRKTFLVGHFWHAWLQEILVRSGLAKSEAIERRGHKVWDPNPQKLDRAEMFMGQIPVPEGVKGLPNDKTHFFKPRAFHWATGSADVAPCSIPRHGDWIVDFKTMNSRDFALTTPPMNRYNGGATTGEKWEAQLNIYMDWFDLEKALIVGIEKDSPHNFKEFEFHRNQPLIDAIYRKWEIVSICLDEDDVPHPDEDPEMPYMGPVES